MCSTIQPSSFPEVHFAKGWSMHPKKLNQSPDLDFPVFKDINAWDVNKQKTMQRSKTENRGHGFLNPAGMISTKPTLT